jgi:hypothetical protein
LPYKAKFFSVPLEYAAINLDKGHNIDWISSFLTFLATTYPESYLKIGNQVVRPYLTVI